MWKASFDPSGDQTGPEPSLVMFLKIVTLPVAMSATAIWRISRRGGGRQRQFVLNARRVPSGEMSGHDPVAILFAAVPSRLAIQTLRVPSRVPRSKAMRRSPENPVAEKTA